MVRRMARPKRTDGASERAVEQLEVDQQPARQAGGPQVGASAQPAGPDVRAARLERARVLLEEVRQAGRTHGRPYDRDVLRLIEAVLGVQG